MRKLTQLSLFLMISLFSFSMYAVTTNPPDA